MFNRNSRCREAGVLVDIVVALLFFLLSVVFVGCGLGGADAEADLKALATAYRNATERSSGPDTWEALEAAGLPSRARKNLANGRYKVEFDVDLLSKRVSDNNFVLAYPAYAAARGGLVVTLDGHVAQLTAAEFRQKFAMQQGLASWPMEVVKLGAPEELQAGDMVAVPLRGAPHKAAVEKVLPDNQILVRLPVRTSSYLGSPAEPVSIELLVFDRRHVWSIGPMKEFIFYDHLSYSGTDEPELEQKRREDAAHAATATAWPKHELIELTTDEWLYPGDVLFAPQGSSMTPVEVVGTVWSPGANAPDGSSRRFSDETVVLVVRRGREAGPDHHLVARYELRRRVPTAQKHMREPLRELFAACGAFDPEHHYYPANWDDLLEKTPTAADGDRIRKLQEQFTASNYEVVFGIRGFIGPDWTQFILAYPRNAAQEGGLILTGAGSVKEFTAEEFRRLREEQVARIDMSRRTELAQAIPPANVRLEEIGPDEKIQPNDVVYVPIVGRMLKAQVLALLPGQVKVRPLDPPRGVQKTLIRDTWQVRREVPLERIRAEEAAKRAAEQARTDARNDARNRLVEQFGAAYAKYFDEQGAAPTSWSDLQPLLPGAQLEKALKAERYETLFSAREDEMPAGRSNFLVAWPASGSGLVAFADGATRQMTAKEIRVLQEAQITALLEARAARRTGGNAPLSPAQKLHRSLTRLFEAYAGFHDAHARGPADWPELEKGGRVEGLRQELEAAGYRVVFGIDLKRADMNSFIVAHPNDAADQGGLVLQADGAVKLLTYGAFLRAMKKQDAPSP